MTELTGGCSCGATRYTVAEPGPVIICHCTDCQRQSGSAFGEVMVVDEAGFAVTRGEVRSFAMTAASGRPKTGHFCADCGTRIYHLNTIRPGKISLRAGTLDETHGLTPVKHIWTASKQPWVLIPEGVEAAEDQG